MFPCDANQKVYNQTSHFLPIKVAKWLKFPLPMGEKKTRKDGERRVYNEKDEKKWFLVYIILWDDIAIE